MIVFHLLDIASKELDHTHVSVRLLLRATLGLRSCALAEPRHRLQRHLTEHVGGVLSPERRD